MAAHYNVGYMGFCYRMLPLGCTQTFRNCTAAILDRFYFVFIPVVATVPAPGVLRYQ